MKVTRITEKNREFFEELIPEELLYSEDHLLLGAISDDDEACAALAVEAFESLALIRWLYTDPDVREQGAATAMMDVLTSILKHTEIEGIEIDFEDRAGGLDDFLTDYGFLVGSDPGIYKVPIADLVYGAVIEELAENDRYEKRIHPLSDGDIGKKTVEFVQRYGMDPTYLTGISLRYSFSAVDEDGNISCCILIRERNDGDLDVAYMASDGSFQLLASTLCAVYDVILEDNRTEGYITFTDRTDKAVEIIEKLTGADSEEYRIPGRKHGIMLNLI